MAQSSGEDDGWDSSVTQQAHLDADEVGDVAVTDELHGFSSSPQPSRRWPADSELNISIPRLAWRKHRRWIVLLGILVVVAVGLFALVRSLQETAWVQEQNPLSYDGALLAIN